jgi:NADPH:quinone reductase
MFASNEEDPMSIPATALQLLTNVTKDGELVLSFTRVPVPEPGPGEILVRIEATPINPSDLGLLIGPADVSKGRVSGSGDSLTYSAPVPPQALKVLAARLDKPLPVGNEAGGVVVKAGAGAEALLGKTVAILPGGAYAQYRVVKAADALALHDGTTPAEGASCFVNPLTALGMVETMRREGHKAIVHTAAASNLGQMLNRICLKDGVPLVNIVRSEAQVKLLRDAGAQHVLDSTAPNFLEALTEAMKATGATIAFDAIGGGKLPSQILAAMEQAANSGAAYSRYGSSVYKQVYIYGGLDLSPTELTRSYGLTWGVGGWLLTPFLMKIGPVETQKLRQRVADEIKTTFASRYTRTISLAEVMQPDIVAAYNRRATGEKYLIAPQA